MSAPTQEPWQFVVEEGGEWYFRDKQIVIRDASGLGAIAVLAGCDEDDRANARLIAATRDLLSAFQSSMRGEPGWQKLIHAAVAKATEAT